jgi:gliding motility-associated-like protein
MEGYKMTSKRNLCELNTAMKYLFAIVSILSAFTNAFGQQPAPVGIDKVSAGTNGLVTIQGTGFGGDKNDLVVFFGAAKGVIETATDQIIEVHAPAGATYDNISVTNIVTGLTGYTRQHFLLSFGADFGFLPTNLVGQTDFSVGSGLYDQCLCDFNGDNKTDVVTVNDDDSPVSSTISILTNTSTVGTVNFTMNTASISARSVHARCGDLNGDGKPDLVVSEGGVGNRIFILQNTSGGTISFTAPQAITLTGMKPKQVQIADVDLDGKPDIITTNLGGNKIAILQNQSIGAISFNPTPIVVTATGAVTTDGLIVEDLNADQRPDIIVSQFLTSSSNLFVLHNNSTPGNISFSATSTITIGNSVVNLEIGDLDGDRKPDLAVTQLLANGISVFLNTTTGSTISFGTPKPYLTDIRPWGIDFGDLDGDGKTDIVVASVFAKSITVLNNISSIGSTDFQPHIIPTTFINRHVNIGDLDGDGKPDIAFTSIDDNNNGIPASKVSVFRNKTCMTPKLSPEGPLTICAGFPLQLQSTVSDGATYEWKLNGTTVATGTTSTFNVAASGTYTVTAIAEGGTCSEISNSVVITVGTGTAVGTAVPFNNGPACAGSSVTLGVNNVAGATQYLWTGPATYTGTGLAPAAITDFQLEKAGRYFVDVMIGTCLAQRTSTLVEIIDIPEFNITSSSGTVICQGEDNELTVSPSSGFTFKWLKNGVEIGGATTPSYTATTAGSYTVQPATTGACVIQPTAPIVLTVVSLPTAAFTAPTQACTNELVTFTNQSTVDGSVPAVYEWKFIPGSTLTDRDPKLTFTSAGIVNINLTVSYGNNACAQVATGSIQIIAGPAVSVVNPSNKYSFCEGDSLLLNAVVGGAFTSITWNTGETTSSIYAKEDGVYFIDVQTTGCLLHAERTLATDPSPAVLVTASPADVTEGESSQLEASGLANYTWTPPDGLSSTTIFNPLATPLATTIYTVKGTSAGFTCPGIATIQVTVKGEAIVNKLIPAKFFSPNQDDKNPLWLVENILDFQQCGVTIYDDKGVKVYEAKPYLNDWDGTFNGQKLPDGVYYYVIRCDGEENKPRTGSITVLR